MVKNLLAAAVVAASMPATAQQSINNSATGQVILYPFYSTEGGGNTLLHVSNTTDSAKAVKVRLMEGVSSSVVLEFNLYLPAHGTFASAINEDAAPSISTTSDACTVPMLGTANGDYDGYTKELFDGSTLRVQPLVPYQFESDKDNALSRLAVGHAEVIEMGVVDDDIDVTDCDAIGKLWLTGDWSGSGGGDSTIGSPVGGLMGSSVFINPNDAYSLAIYPAAIDGWAKEGVNYHAGAGTLLPTLDQGVRKASLWDGSDFVELDYSTNEKGAVMAMSALLATSVVAGEFTVETSIAAESDMVVTFPLKKYFRSTGGDAIAPFTTVYDGTKEENKQCEEVSLVSFSRDGEATAGSGTFVPEETGIAKFLCNNVNVLSIGDSSALQVSRATSVSGVFESGRLKLSIDQVAGEDDNGVVVGGLGVVGFNATRIVNGDKSYGYSSAHKTLTVTSGG
jgi:hypothetical protein